MLSSEIFRQISLKPHLPSYWASPIPIPLTTLTLDLTPGGAVSLKTSSSLCSGSASSSIMKRHRDATRNSKSLITGKSVTSPEAS